MGKMNAHIHALNAGEVSASALARVDQERLRVAAEIQENLLPHAIGKAIVRPGMGKVERTYSDVAAKILRFVRSPTETALLVCTHLLLKIIVDDAYVERASVSSTVGDGDFSSSASWTTSATTGATVTISGGILTMSADARGSSTLCKQSVTTSSANTEHALRIEVTQGAVLFRCGSSDGNDDYIAETELGVGYHSLAFTPTASPYYIRFFTRTDLTAKVTSCQIESAGDVQIPANWGSGDLSLIRYAQSADVVFLAWGAKQAKIERRASGRSWSVVEYDTDDGPFITSDTSNITMTPGAAYGVTTMTASDSAFKPTDVGRLIRVVPSGYNSPFVLAAADTYTEAVRIFGVGVDMVTAITITGTFTGTLTFQRSYDGPDTGFIDVTTLTWTAAATSSYSPGTTLDNVEHWIRIGFNPGDYTSGSATVTLDNNGGSRAGVYRILAYSSSTSVDVQTLSPPGSLSPTKVWSLGAWSDRTQWPTAVGFFDGRLFWGGLDKFWASESDNYYAFNLDDEGDAGSIQRAVATGSEVNAIRWFLPLQRHIVGTTGSEVSIRSSNFDEPLTPTNVTLKDASTHGVAEVNPVRTDKRGFFVHRDGVRLFEIVYDIESNDYSSRSTMILNSEIGGTGITALAVQRSPETYIWAVRADGQCLVLAHDPAEKMNAWVRVIAGANAADDTEIEDVQVLPSSGPDRVYFVVKRTIDGGTVRTIEKLALHSEATGGSGNRMLDSYVHVAGSGTSVTGLSHLEGETVEAWGVVSGVAKKIGTTYTVSGGAITLSETATYKTAGLPYDWRFKSAKLAYAAQGGTPLLQPKRVNDLGVILENAHPSALTYGSDFDRLYNMPSVENGSAVDTDDVWTTYDEKAFSFDGTWDTDSRVCLKGSAPYPCTINGIVIGIETSED